MFGLLITFKNKMKILNHLIIITFILQLEYQSLIKLLRLPTLLYSLRLFITIEFISVFKLIHRVLDYQKLLTLLIRKILLIGPILIISKQNSLHLLKTCQMLNCILLQIDFTTLMVLLSQMRSHWRQRLKNLKQIQIFLMLIYFMRIIN